MSLPELRQAFAHVTKKLTASKGLHGLLLAVAQVANESARLLIANPLAGGEQYVAGKLKVDQLLVKGGPVFDVTAYGATGDGTTDDYTAIAAAVSAAAAAATAGQTATLFFPPAIAYDSASPVVVGAGINVIMEAPLVYTGSSNVAALTIGITGASNGYGTFKINVERATQSDWSSESNIGVLFYSPTKCDITIVATRGFTIGAQFNGHGAGCHYNTVMLGDMRNAKIGLDITNNSTGTSGWCNENVFIGGRFWQSTGVNSGTARTGIRITSQDAVYTTNNNNTFLKPSIESPDGTTATAISIEYGAGNHFQDVRAENITTGVEFKNASYENVVAFGYESLTTQSTDTSTNGTNVVIGARTRHIERMTRPIFALTDIINTYAPWSGTSIMVPGCSLVNANPPVKNSAGYVLGADYIEFNSSRGVGVLVDTTINKEFLLARDVSNSQGGRIGVKCFDAAGAALDNTGPNHPYAKGSAAAPISYNAAAGGVYRTGADSTGQAYVKVNDDVKSAWIGIIGGSSAARVKGFAIYTTPIGSAPGVTAGYAGATERRRAATQSPQTSGIGTWAVGNVVWASAPAAGSAAGWVCTVAGSPGTWTPVGYVDGLTQAVTSSTATIEATTTYLTVDYAGACALTLPASTYTGPGIQVKDISGTCSDVNVISFVLGSGTTLEYAHTLTAPFESITWYLDGTVWRAR
jgi:hypothetical protein